MPTQTTPSTTQERGRRAARKLAGARLISMCGSQAAFIALAYLLWTTTHEPAWVAACMLSSSLVLGIASVFAGPMADKFDRRRLMIASDVAAGIVFGALAVAAWQEAPPIVLVLLVAVATIAESPFVAASRAALPNLVSDEDLPWANALIGRATSLVFTVAPIAGGAMAGFFSPFAALAVNAASFAVSALLVASIRVPFSERYAQSSSDDASNTSEETYGVRAGLGEIWRAPLLRASIYPGLIAFLGVGFVLVANPALADSYDVGAIGYGAFMGVWGAGALIASFFVQKLLIPGREFSIAVIGILLHAVAMFGVWFSASYWIALAVLAVGGVGMGLTDPARQTIIQRHARDSLRGRAFGVMESVGWTSFALSLVGAGALVSKIGIRDSYLVAGVLFVVGAGSMLALRAWPRPRVVAQLDTV